MKIQATSPTTIAHINRVLISHVPTKTARVAISNAVIMAISTQNQNPRIQTLTLLKALKAAINPATTNLVKAAISLVKVVISSAIKAATNSAIKVATNSVKVVISSAIKAKAATNSAIRAKAAISSVAKARVATNSAAKAAISSVARAATNSAAKAATNNVATNSAAINAAISSKTACSKLAARASLPVPSALNTKCRFPIPTNKFVLTNS